MPHLIPLRLDGREVHVADGTSVAAALLEHSRMVCRQSVSGMPRGPLCAMGICFECRVTVDGIPHQRGCMILCETGMDVRTS